MQTLSVIMLAQNEEACIATALQSVAFADEVIVVDGGSTDTTREIARQMGARVIDHPWSGFGAQFNFAATQATCDWILRVDTDEQVTPELQTEIREVLRHPERPEAAYWIARPITFLGRRLRYGNLYPDGHLRLWRRGLATFTQVEADERLQLVEDGGRVGRLRGVLEHRPWANLDELVDKTILISRIQAQDVVSGRKPRRRWPGLMVVLAFARKFVEVYVVRQGWRDGLVGYIYATCAAFRVFLRETRLWTGDVTPAGADRATPTRDELAS
jgi:glycosyltransferase involved in cell wall biosynthesis